MLIKKLRLQRGWSQEQLAECSGISVRTIQRIEKGQNAGLESIKSLAAVFDVPLSDLQEPDMQSYVDQPTTVKSLSPEEEKVFNEVKNLRSFYQHLIGYALTMALLAVINWIVTPDYWWVVWPMLGWGIGIVSHAISIFSPFLGPSWEKRQIEKRLGRKL